MTDFIELFYAVEMDFSVKLDFQKVGSDMTEFAKHFTPPKPCKSELARPRMAYQAYPIGRLFDNIIVQILEISNPTVESQKILAGQLKNIQVLLAESLTCDLQTLDDSRIMPDIK